VVFEPVTRRNLNACLEWSRHVLNTSFDTNPRFVPPSAEEYLFQADGMRWILDPRLSSVALVKGEPVGAIVVIPDVNPLLKAIGSTIGWTTPYHVLRHKLFGTRAVIVFQGVVPAFQRQGLNPAMLARSCAALVKAGYTQVGGTWIADSNTASLRQVEKVGGQKLHRLHLFGKTLSA
jgi:ribosomal protein S18 acetylase RimI-like enzyme